MNKETKLKKELMKGYINVQRNSKFDYVPLGRGQYFIKNSKYI